MTLFWAHAGFQKIASGTLQIGDYLFESGIMQHGFVPNGGERLENQPDYRAWRKARMEAIKAEYAPLLAQARGGNARA